MQKKNFDSVETTKEKCLWEPILNNDQMEMFWREIVERYFSKHDSANFRTDADGNTVSTFEMYSPVIFC